MTYAKKQGLDRLHLGGHEEGHVSEPGLEIIAAHVVVGHVLGRYAAILIHHDEFLLEKIVQSGVDYDEGSQAEVFCGKIYPTAGLGEVFCGDECTDQGERDRGVLYASG
jgi:hypothetical protein